MSKELGTCHLLKDGKLNIQLHPMFQTIAVNLPKAEQEMVLARTSFETQNSAQILAKKGKTPALADVCPSWLGFYAEVRIEFSSYAKAMEDKKKRF